VESANAAGHPHTLLRVDRPAPGAVFASACPAGDKVFITVNFYLYGDTAAAVAARDEAAWTAWMTNLFPA
jgi:hypothetical protein